MLSPTRRRLRTPGKGPGRSDTAVRAVVLLLMAAETAAAQDAAALEGIHKIRHVVIIMQENRSFDSYFGTFPGADGIPMHDGAPATCSPDPRSQTCVAPYHDSKDRNAGGPHTAKNAVEDIDGGRMDGFVREAQTARHQCSNPLNPDCANDGGTDVMGYHDDQEIPNYWAYAKAFVLQDRMFEPNASWSLPAHLFLVSGWSARCANDDPMSCRNDLDGFLPLPARSQVGNVGRNQAAPKIVAAQ
jgi:phospholipase C